MRGLFMLSLWLKMLILYNVKYLPYYVGFASQEKNVGIHRFLYLFAERVGIDFSIKFLY